MTKTTKSIFAIAFILALGAGVAVGMLTARTTSAPPGGDPRSWLVDQLQLTKDQQQQMESIWTGLQSQGRIFAEELAALERQRDADIARIMSEEQREQFERVHQAFAAKSQALWERAEREFKNAAETTRAMLNEAQRVKFDAMLERFRQSRGRGGPPGGGWMGPGRGPGGFGRGPAPATAPAEKNQF